MKERAINPIRFYTPVLLISLFLLSALSAFALEDGVYPSSSSVGAITFTEDYEAWLGKPVSHILQFPPMDTWAHLKGDNGLGLSWWMNQLNGADQSFKDRVIISMGMLPANAASVGATHAKGANGDYNSNWVIVAERLRDNGFGDCIIRLGWEFNGDWYAWSAQGKQASFRDYWKEIVTSMRSVNGTNFKFLWNPTAGDKGMGNPLDAFPDDPNTSYEDDYVDYVGLDLYDVDFAYGTTGYPDNMPQWQVDNIRSNAWLNLKEYGLYHLDWWVSQVSSMERQDGSPMPLTIPEWGLADVIVGSSHGGLDNPYFIEKMHDWLTDPSNGVEWHVYFEDNNSQYRHQIFLDDQYPLSEWKYLELFGTGLPVLDQFFFDNNDTNVSFSGIWHSSTGGSGSYYGSDYVHDGDSSTLKEAFFQPDLEPGYYDVYINYTSSSNRADNTPIDVIHSDGIDLISLDQTSGGGVWQSLGSYYFSPDGFQGVLLSNDGANGYVIADALRYDWQTAGEYFEAESVSRTTSGASSSVISDSLSNGGNWVKLNSNNPGDSIIFTLTDVASGVYEVKLWLKEQNGRGQYTVTLGTQTVGTTFDQYNPSDTYANHYLGLISVPSDGDYDLKLEVVGKNASSSGHTLAIDAIEFQPTTVEVVLDNADSPGVVTTGSWSSSASTSGFYGADYLHDQNSGKGFKSVTFTPNLPLDGDYEVFARWTGGPNRSLDTPISLTHQGGTFNTTVDQRVRGGQWVSIGVFSFNSGTSANLTISNTGTNGYVIVDAVRFKLR